VTSQIKWTSTISPQLLLESQVVNYDAGIAVASTSDFFIPIGTNKVLNQSGVIQTYYPCSAFNCDPQLGERNVYQFDLIQGTINGPFNVKTDDSRVRNSIKTDLSYNLEDAWGQHNIKSGIEFADEKFSDAPLNNPLLVDTTTPFNPISMGGGPPPSPVQVEGDQVLQTFDPLVRQLQQRHLCPGLLEASPEPHDQLRRQGGS
jgi:hypothetical protein